MYSPELVSAGRHSWFVCLPMHLLMRLAVSVLSTLLSYIIAWFTTLALLSKCLHPSVI